MNKLQATLWIGSLAAQLERDGHPAEVNALGKLPLPFPSTWVGLVRDVPVPDKWCLELVVQVPVTSTMNDGDIQAQLVDILRKEAPEFSEAFNVIRDEFKASKIEFGMFFDKKIKFPEFIDFVQTMVNLTHFLLKEFESQSKN